MLSCWAAVKRGEFAIACIGRVLLDLYGRPWLFSISDFRVDSFD